jgi:UDP-N-acetylglucosamine 4,6-dehydratase
VRYGNVVGSRGSVVPLFIKQRANGKITITDERMTRFWLSLEQGVHFVISCIEQMEGGEVFIPKIPSTKVIDLARAIAPEAEIEIIGIRPGEKLHEGLLSVDEARHTVELERMYVVQPTEAIWFGYSWQNKGKALPDGFSYTSDTNTQWLDVEGIRRYIEPFEHASADGTLEG